MKKIIYLDNAATSFPKPQEVIDNMNNYFYNIGANAGRSSHQLAKKVEFEILQCREKVSKFFNVGRGENVIFTKNATESANLTIFGIIKKGDTVISSDIEHRAVIQPLIYLKEHGIIDLKILQTNKYGIITEKEIRDKINGNEKLAILSHSSNVIGTISNINKIGKILKEKGILFALDASQTAGIKNIDMIDDNIDFLIMPGHKGLMGPQGIGLLCIKKGNEKIIDKPLIYGGIGFGAKDLKFPTIIPNFLEAGTLNLLGIFGLSAAIDFINKIGLKQIQTHHEKLIHKIYTYYQNNNKIRLYGNFNFKNYFHNISIINININGILPSEIGYLLDKQNICTRVGLACNPDSHRKFNTFPNGTVRISIGYYNTESEIDYLIKVIDNILANL